MSTRILRNWTRESGNCTANDDADCRLRKHARAETALHEDEDGQKAIPDVDAESHGNRSPAKASTRLTLPRRSTRQAPTRSARFPQTNQAIPQADTSATSRHEKGQTTPQTPLAGRLAAQSGEATGRRASSPPNSRCQARPMRP